jgi:23S rRNA (cytidine1920-2'-O)/16S rRNA (cytidine1409-2'-O)-methyltransferase
MVKKRLDDLLVERGLAKSRKEALAKLMSGVVLVDHQLEEKGGTLVDSESEIRLSGDHSKYVSRGGLKLEGALEALKLDVSECVCLDLGASTGGFTDCLLHYGADRVYAFDVGRGQLDWKLQQNPKVIVRDGFNVRYLSRTVIEEEVDLIVLDLSFISVKQVLLALRAFPEAAILALIKPQFEAERSEVEPGGLVTDTSTHRAIVQRVRDFAVENGFTVLAEVPSPVLGRKGNQEVFLHLLYAAV